MKVIIENKKARFNYFIDETYDAGVVLEGWEAKSISKGKVNFEESYVKVINGEVFLIGCTVTPLESTSTHNVVDKTRTKKLLLNKKEITKLIGGVARDGYTLVPIKMFLNDRRKIKVQIGLAKGKKLFDKRETIKNRDVQRDIQRQLAR